MTAVLLAGAIVTLSVVAIRLQRSDAMPDVLRVLPAALLFLTIPAASSGYAMLRGFHEVGMSGSSEQIPALMHAACTTMLWGSIGLLATIAAAAIIGAAGGGGATSVTLQLGDSAPPAAVDPSSGANAVLPARRAPQAPQWPTLLAPAALVPAVLVSLFVADIASVVMQATAMRPRIELAGATEPVQIAGMALTELSRWMSNRIVLTIGIGGLGSLLLGLLALLNMLPMRESSPRRGTIRYAWSVAAITAAAGVGLAVRFAIVLWAIESGS
jgi:hypothetical protein